VYELVVRHFLACCSKDAVGRETAVDVGIAGERFRATGACGVFLGGVLFFLGVWGVAVQT
jgi:DNA topoisomerase IA